MSGIAGILNFDGKPINKHDIESMLHLLSARGPHGRGLYIDENVGLGHSLLNTSLYPERESIPLIHPNKQFILTFDGRIDNRADLLATLKLQINDARDAISDERLVLAAYEKWGKGCPAHLRGDFSFAIWDRKKRILFCARDHFGVKPFYYHCSNQYFIFGSSPYAILAARKELHEINEPRIADYLLGLEGIDEISTFYKDIHRLPHGHSLSVNSREVARHRFWELNPVENYVYDTDDDYIAAFKETFTEAVRCRLGAPPSTTVPLSGGMDSASIVATARQLFALQGKGALITFSGITSNPDDHETERILAVINQGALQPHIFSEDYILQHIDGLISRLAQVDEPFDCLSNTWRALYGQAQENNIHISLVGFDGDLILSGINHISALWKSGEFRTVFEETIFADGLTKIYHRHPVILFYKSLRAAFAPDWMRKLRRDLDVRTAVTRVKRNSLISNEFAYSSRLAEREMQYTSYGIQPPSMTQIDAHRKSISHPHLQVALEGIDRIAATFSIEARHPFLDVRLVEFCLGLPWRLKTRRGWTKMILRRGMESSLPDIVVWGKDKNHPNWGFSLQMLRARKEYFRVLLNDDIELLKSYVDINELNKAWNRFLLYDQQDAAARIWKIIGLTFWLRRQREIPY